MKKSLNSIFFAFLDELDHSTHILHNLRKVWKIDPFFYYNFKIFNKSQKYEKTTSMLNSRDSVSFLSDNEITKINFIQIKQEY